VEYSCILFVKGNVCPKYYDLDKYYRKVPKTRYCEALTVTFRVRLKTLSSTFICSSPFCN